MMEPPEVPRRWRDSALFRLGAIGALVLALLVPVTMVRSLVAERMARRDSAASAIAADWGGSQVVGGPVLVVPYRYWRTYEKGKPTLETDLAYFLPEVLDIEGEVTPDKRKRGIFETAVYSSQLEIQGVFARPDFSAWGIEDTNVVWQDAVVVFGVSDLRGIGSDVALAWNGAPAALEPGSAQVTLWSSGISARVPLPAVAGPPATYPFHLKLDLAGSDRLDFLPLGKETRTVLRSPWPDPSFGGAFLPATHTITPKGFEARWLISYFGRSYPQQWRGLGPPVDVSTVGASAFGVGLYLPADVYQKADRSTKYAVLFLLLTFVTFFLYEVLTNLRVHPVQYLLVGAALCVFYLLLLSLAEQISFALAYAVAASATVVLIAGYCAAILGARTRAALLASILGVLYGYLYVLLQAEDYALLLGSAGLFVILGIVMFLTRRVNWYGMTAQKEALQV